MLNDILTLDQQWLPNQSDFLPISWPWYRLWPSPNYEWFPWSICNGCGMPAGNAYPSGHLVPSPILGLANAPNSSNLPCLYSTFHLEYPLVLSRFCFNITKRILANFSRTKVTLTHKRNIFANVIAEWIFAMFRLLTWYSKNKRIKEASYWSFSQKDQSPTFLRLLDRTLFLTEYPYASESQILPTL